MPFKSGKQRRYLWANEPEIARDWTKKYGSRVRKVNGGIMDKIMPYVYPEAHAEKYSTRGQWAKDTPQYHRDITENYFDELSKNWSQLPYIGKPAAAAIELFAPAATGIMNIPYDTYSAFKKFYENPQKYEDPGKWSKVNAFFPDLADTNVAGILSALDREDMLSAAGNRFVGATRPLAKRMQKGWDAIKNEFSGSAQAGEPDKNNFRGHPLYGTERPERFNKQHDFQGTKISSPAEREAINQINKGYLPYMENRKTAQIPYNTGEFDWIDRGKGADIFPRTEPGSDLSTQMYKDAYGWGETPIAQQLANLDKIIQEPRRGFPHDSSVYDKWGNIQMAQEKMDPARPQRKGWRNKIGAGITNAWGALTGNPWVGLASQAFKGQQLTPQQKQMNTNFMKQYGVTRAPPTMGGRMVGGPFAGMNKPGTSAFGSPTSKAMAQKWMDKYGGMDYQTEKMQRKQQQIKNIATMNQGPPGIIPGSGDKMGMPQGGGIPAAAAASGMVGSYDADWT